MTTFSRQELRSQDDYANAARHCSQLTVAFARASTGVAPLDLPLGHEFGGAVASIEAALVAATEDPSAGPLAMAGVIEAAATYLQEILPEGLNNRSAETLRTLSCSMRTRMAISLSRGPSA